MVETVWESFCREIKELFVENPKRGETITDWMWLAHQAWTDFDQAKSELRGWNIKIRQRETLIVVKAKIEGANVVCFISGRTIDDAVRIFRRQYLAEMVNWVPDQFA